MYTVIIKKNEKMLVFVWSRFVERLFKCIYITPNVSMKEYNYILENNVHGGNELDGWNVELR